MTHSASKDRHRPFFARIIRKFSVLVVFAWLALLVVVNVVVPQLEPVTKANRSPLVPLNAPSATVASIPSG